MVRRKHLVKRDFIEEFSGKWITEYLMSGKTERSLGEIMMLSSFVWNVVSIMIERLEIIN